MELATNPEDRTREDLMIEERNDQNHTNGKDLPGTRAGSIFNGHVQKSMRLGRKLVYESQWKFETKVEKGDVERACGSEYCSNRL
jgi:hypothetical protein